ncbi:cyclic peptide export ABC transporter [Hymenobacter sp. HSC-4F20]|uniref:cyclic peptide export ABC transporter n=1 Tax=Hymenobacter sp. HSC-4F20 TaxID=2864135 RepID=UPI001C73BC93|nr:cyclic peptide export ABC transporter [Hymenobacter sp. HSC-4F20]MBX0293007.1 cyclic peptide export ABC transporter [Hymenobacter sp. HSC-4F20]
MNLLKGHFGKYALFVALGILAAAGNTAIIFIINKIVSNSIQGIISPSREYLYLFAGSLALFFVSRWLVSQNMISFMLRILRQVRLEVVEMVLTSAYHPLIKNKERIYTALTRDTNNVVNASVNVIDLMTNFIIILLCCGYMAFLSWKLLLCTCLLMAFTVLIYTVSEKKALALFDKAMASEDSFVRHLNEILVGFKEIKIARAKGTDIVTRHMYPAVDTASAYNKKALVYHLNNRVIGQLAFYVFIGALLLFLGDWLSISGPVIINFIFVLMYIWGPIESVVLMVPGLAQAHVSLNRLSSLKESLQEKDVEGEPVAALQQFDSLKLYDVSYQYTSEEDTHFSVGPNDFSLRRGEVAFVYGGNGSGKTTFINVLIGLFVRETGQVYINDEALEEKNFTAYRALFAPVFSDFHLFEEFYGVEHVNETKAQEYLRVFELDKKVEIKNNKLTTINLSTGQKKRLALVCAMLERKPILILDEFAADQDPYFRKKFYTEILDYLKEEGFSVVAITHDDNYYPCADKLYKMNYGKLESVTKVEALNAAYV